MMHKQLAGSTLKLSVSGAAIQGQRSEQQDTYRSLWLETERAWLLVLADGMGGHAAGAIASNTAVDAFITAFSAARSTGAHLEDALRSSLASANQRIANRQKMSPETAGMGTTFVAVHLSSNGAGWISVGDSPLWLFREGKLSRLNEDHSLRTVVAVNAKASRNLLRSALNGQPTPLIDCRPEPLPLRAGDLVLLASDGLLTLNDTEISEIARQNAKNGPQAMAQSILKAVEGHRKSNQDNCAILIASAEKSMSEMVDG